MNNTIHVRRDQVRTMETSAGITYEPESGSHSSSVVASASHPVSASGNFTSHAIRCLKTILIALCALTIATSIAWLVLHPRPPVFRVDSLHVSGSLYTLNLTATNPNPRVTIFLRLESVVMIRDHLPSRGEPAARFPEREAVGLPENGFVLGKMSHARVSAVFPASHSERVVPPHRHRVVAAFDVEMKVLTKYRAGEWPTSVRTLVFVCRDVKVAAVSSKSGNVGSGDLPHGGVDCILSGSLHR